MGLDLKYIRGQTPLDEEEKDGLLIPIISTQAELDEFEQQNIEQALQWILSRSLRQDLIFSEEFIRLVHRKMFANVWDWAGNFRKTDKNIGVKYWQIPIELKNLLDDVNYWIKNEIYTPDEISLRFKHRIVCIHCFPNGNGRHSRLMADIIIEKIYKKSIFSWGKGNLSNEGDARASYLKAIKTADQGDFSLLLRFARS